MPCVLHICVAKSNVSRLHGRMCPLHERGKGRPTMMPLLCCCTPMFGPPSHQWHFLRLLLLFETPILVKVGLSKVGQFFLQSLFGHNRHQPVILNKCGFTPYGILAIFGPLLRTCAVFTPCDILPFLGPKPTLGFQAFFWSKNRPTFYPCDILAFCGPSLWKSAVFTLMTFWPFLAPSSGPY